MTQALSADKKCSQYNHNLNLVTKEGRDDIELKTSFTEGDTQDRSTSGGGLENEIRQIKALLGQLAQDYNVRVSQQQPTR